MQIGGILAVAAALGLTGCYPSKPAAETSQEAAVDTDASDQLSLQSVERYYICPDRSLDSLDEKQAISRVSEILRSEGRNPASLYMKAFRRENDGPSMQRVVVGGECGSPMPVSHEYWIYSVDLATNEVDVWVPN